MTFKESADWLDGSVLNNELDLAGNERNKILGHIQEIHNHYAVAVDVLQRDAILHGRQAEAMKDFGKRLNEENNAKLMAIYYSLDMLATCGTHHEKNVVLVHLKATIDRMINREFNGISYKNDDLPF